MDEEVDVALLAGVATSNAAEDADGARSVVRCDLQDPVPMFVEERTQRRGGVDNRHGTRLLRPQTDGPGARHTPEGPSPIRENIGENTPPV